MSTPADVSARFRALLKREREALRGAQFDLIEAIQVEKRSVLDEMRSATIDPRELEELGAFARYNVGLLRHLISLLRGASGLPEVPASYGGRGQWVPPRESGRVRGAA